MAWQLYGYGKYHEKPEEITGLHSIMVIKFWGNTDPKRTTKTEIANKNDEHGAVTVANLLIWAELNENHTHRVWG